MTGDDVVEAFVDRHPLMAGCIVFGFFLLGTYVERRRKAGAR